VARLLQNGRDVILVTAHRRESFGAGLENVCEALRAISIRLPETTIVYPIHPNPNVRVPVTALLKGTANIHLIEPVEYHDFVLLMDRAKIILTDSGGIQEEAPSLGKPVLVLRDVTERQEAVDAGVVVLVGTERKRIVETTVRLMSRQDDYNRMVCSSNPYGDGHAAERIASAIRKRCGLAGDIPEMVSAYDV
jgi:UDP-N-acetylglucosamine 2-epimerase (non-hydrolysing)